ncbi:MAG: DUF1735 domain-containing protein [Tannerella sp.]|nr:DUF1735 domain-containing protein [Tannerella sp.]
MKKSIIKYLGLALALFGMSSCLPDEVRFEDGLGDIVEIYNLSSNRSGLTYASRDLKALLAYPGEYDFEITNTSFSFPVVVNYTGNNGAPSDVTVTLAVDEGIADVVGKESGLAYEILPASAYTLPGTTIVIPKGTNRVNYQVSVNAASLTKGQRYVFGIKITGATAGVISGNFSSGGFYFLVPE